MRRDLRKWALQIAGELYFWQRKQQVQILSDRNMLNVIKKQPGCQRQLRPKKHKADREDIRSKKWHSEWSRAP